MVNAPSGAAAAAAAAAAAEGVGEQRLGAERQGGAPAAGPAPEDHFADQFDRWVARCCDRYGCCACSDSWESWGFFALGETRVTGAWRAAVAAEPAECAVVVGELGFSALAPQGWCLEGRPLNGALLKAAY